MSIEFLIITILLSLFYVSGQNCLWPGEKLRVGDCLTSYAYTSLFSVCLQKDGRLCVSSFQTSTWCTNSSNSSPSYAAFDTTGSFYLFDQSDQPYFTLHMSANTKGERDSYMVIRPDGNLAIYPNRQASTEFPPFYECLDQGCDTFDCDNCDTHLCMNTEETSSSSSSHVDYTIVLCTVIPVAVLILTRVFHRLIYGDTEEKTEVDDDLPTLADFEIIPKTVANNHSKQTSHLNNWLEEKTFQPD